MRNEETSTSCEAIAIVKVEFNMLFILFVLMGQEREKMQDQMQQDLGSN